MGVKRRLDYVFASKCFTVQESGPSNILGLGSDHRVVRTVLTAQKRKTKTYVKKVQMKGWYPEIDSHGTASKYQEKLDEKLDYQSADVESINKALYEAATSPDVRTEVPGKAKPWESEEIQSLIQQRRLCNTSIERASISKQIQKVSRGILRKHQTEEATKKLQESSGLSDLPKMQDYPTKHSGNSTEIDSKSFAQALQEIYEDPEGTIYVEYGKIKDVPLFT